MAVYVVMEPEGVGAANAQEQALFVRDGFHALAFVLPVVWLLINRLWIEALAALVVTLSAGALATQLGGHPLLASALSLLIGLYFGLEASALRIWALQRRGYRIWGTVEAHNLREAELRYATDADEVEEVELETETAFPWASTIRTVPASRPDKGLGLVAYPWSR